jgi:glycosyltransferase 2 family protein
MGKKVLKTAGKLVVSGLLIGLLFWKVDAAKVAADLGKLRPEFVFFAWAYYVVCQLLSSYRWQMFLKVKGIRVSLAKLFSFYMIGMFLNHFLPGAVGGDVAKSYYLYRETGEGKYAVASVFLERFTGLIGLSALSLAGLVVWWRYLESPLVLGAVGGTALFLLAVILMLWWPPLSRPLNRLVFALSPRRVGEPLRKVYEALEGYRDCRGTLVGAVALSTGIQCLYALFYALVSRELGTPIDLQYFILFLPLVTLAIMVPVSVGGLGVREGLMILLFGEVGVPAEHVLAVSLTAYLLNTLLSLLGAVFLVVQRKPGSLPGEVVDDV